jgi:hypothetical protein
MKDRFHMDTNLPNYKKNDPKGWCGDPKRGAALGRSSIHDVASDFSGDVFLSESKIDEEGYDQLGTYFGVGLPLYWAATVDSSIDFMLRAFSVEDAEMKVKKRYPSARIVRA